MRHPFAIRLLDHMSQDCLDQLKNLVETLEYQTFQDFEAYAIQATPALSIGQYAPLQDLVDQHLLEYFDASGHIATNVAQMQPGAYVSEHSDLGAEFYGSIQHSVIKLQIPVKTNPGAGLMWAHTQDRPAECCSLVEGGIYVMDNVRTHSSVNFSREYRYWITSRWRWNSVRDVSLFQ